MKVLKLNHSNIIIGIKPDNESTWFNVKKNLYYDVNNEKRQRRLALEQ